ncbi:hypothetical protein ACDW34_12505 [Acinetobacter piscicola]|uniref:hypothetical protein n=1 Tax=Acinetobacter piscicola TaxID=2006115 RepID=UPI00355709AB
MSDIIFKINNLDRYDKDADEFISIVESIPNNASDQVIDALFETFSNKEDFGIQETVLSKLDSIPDEKFVNGLIRNFDHILDNSSEQEWALLILGRYVNADDKKRISMICEVGRKNISLFNFIKSDYFMEEYPEVKQYL